AILDEVETGKLQVGQAAGSIVPAVGEKTRIETPYLQLVLTRLWQEEAAVGSFKLRIETIRRLGGAEGIVETHLDAAMSDLTPAEQDIAANVFRYLVTRSRTKIAHTVSDLDEWAGVPEAELTPVLEKLSGGDTRILRPVGESSYEIYHDVLADAVLGWRTEHEAQKKLEEETRDAEARLRRRLLKIGAAVGLVALTGALLLAVYAVSQRNEASHQASIARSREIAARGVSLLSTDPDLGLLLAVKAEK